MVCWQQAIAAECQFLQTLYNHVSPQNQSRESSRRLHYILTLPRNGHIGNTLDRILNQSLHLSSGSARVVLWLGFHSPCNTCEKYRQVPVSKSASINRISFFSFFASSEKFGHFEVQSLKKKKKKARQANPALMFA